MGTVPPQITPIFTFWIISVEQVKLKSSDLLHLIIASTSLQITDTPRDNVAIIVIET